MMSSDQEETELPSEEVKEAGSRSSIIWTAVISFVTGILVSFVTGILGYALKYFFDPPERRILIVTETQTKNLLNLEQKVHDEIITSYALRNTPSETIKSYFRYFATIHNDGDVGVEDLKVFVQINDSDVILDKTPSITTVPPDIRQGITLQQNGQAAKVSKDEWEVSLLNPHESIEFAYIGYSTKEVNNASFKIVPRKKDWKVIREGAEALSESNSFFEKTITEMRGADLFRLIMIFTCFQLVLPVYLVLCTPILWKILPERFFLRLSREFFWRLEQFYRRRR